MSSHREAPEISVDPVADNTDTYAFVSPDKPGMVTILTNYVPLEDPPGGPNFFEFGTDVLYSIYVDNDGVELGRTPRHPDARRTPIEEKPKEVFPVEPYDALLAAGHAHVRHVSRSAREDASIRGRHVSVGADHDMCSNIPTPSPPVNAPVNFRGPPGIASTLRLSIL